MGGRVLLPVVFFLGFGGVGVGHGVGVELAEDKAVLAVQGRVGELAHSDGFGQAAAVFRGGATTALCWMGGCGGWVDGKQSLSL